MSKRNKKNKYLGKPENNYLLNDLKHKRPVTYDYSKDSEEARKAYYEWLLKVDENTFLGRARKAGKFDVDLHDIKNKKMRQDYIKFMEKSRRNMNNIQDDIYRLNNLPALELDKLLDQVKLKDVENILTQPRYEEEPSFMQLNVSEDVPIPPKVILNHEALHLHGDTQGVPEKIKEKYSNQPRAELKALQDLADSSGRFKRQYDIEELNAFVKNNAGKVIHPPEGPPDSTKWVMDEYPAHYVHNIHEEPPRYIKDNYGGVVNKQNVVKMWQDGHNLVKDYFEGIENKHGLHNTVSNSFGIRADHYNNSPLEIKNDFIDKYQKIQGSIAF